LTQGDRPQRPSGVVLGAVVAASDDRCGLLQARSGEPRASMLGLLLVEGVPELLGIAGRWTSPSLSYRW
jgi:hypothetical protein